MRYICQLDSQTSHAICGLDFSVGGICSLRRSAHTSGLSTKIDSGSTSALYPLRWFVRIPKRQEVIEAQAMIPLDLALFIPSNCSLIIGFQVNWNA